MDRFPVVSLYLRLHWLVYHLLPQDPGSSFLQAVKEIILKIKNLNGWKHVNDGIEKDFLFRDFSEAFSFMGRVALLSEKLEHHPDWSGVYNKIHIRLNTHEVGGVTQNDIQMATQIEKYIQ